MLYNTYTSSLDPMSSISPDLFLSHSLSHFPSFPSLPYLFSASLSLPIFLAHCALSVSTTFLYISACFLLIPFPLTSSHPYLGLFFIYSHTFSHSPSLLSFSDMICWDAGSRAERSREPSSRLLACWNIRGSDPRLALAHRKRLVRGP